MTTPRRPTKIRKAAKARSAPGIRRGFRSGLEGQNSSHLRKLGVPVKYEERVIPYVAPAERHTYRPDFELPNGILIETKGKFELHDRKKHLLVKSQHPKLDLRFVFSNPNARIYKGSPTTYAYWCEKHGFKYAKKLIPEQWLDEKGPGRVRITPEAQLPPYTKGKKR